MAASKKSKPQRRRRLRTRIGHQTAPNGMPWWVMERTIDVAATIAKAFIDRGMEPDEVGPATVKVLSSLRTAASDA